jgi:Carboxypeptidase regulatory-like domain/TonB dependent receptor
MCKFLRLAFVSLVIVVMCGLSVMAQSTTTGAIGGVVSNPNKEVVPGATVTVKNIGTNKEDTAVTDGQGRFRVVNLDPGSYSVTINATGFAPFSVDKLTVEVGLVTNVDAPLTIGPVQGGNVIITADAPVINTNQPDFSNNMNQTSINNLPINGQRWSNFALLNPGTVPDANFGLISFRGISGLLNNNTIDGGDNNQAFFSEERGRTRLNYTTSPSSIREFQVNTSNYSAEYGRAAGGVVNAVTKSGTNEFHGQAFYYRRDNKWGARNPLGLLQVPATVSPSGFVALKPEDVRNRWGVTIGGPIKKDKLFWIFTYDELRRNFPGSAIFTPGFILDSQVNNTTLTGAGVGLTQAQVDATKTFLLSLTGATPRQGNQRIFLPKIDWNINSKNTFTFSYNRLRWVSPAGIQTQPTNTLGRRSFGDDFVNGDTYLARLSSNFGPNMVNEFRFQYGRDNEFEFSQVPLPGEPLTAPAYPGVTTAGSRSPDINISGAIDFGTPTFLERPAFPDEKRYQYADTVTLTRGNHTIKFGGDINHVLDVQDNLRNYAGSYFYTNVNDFIVDYQKFLTPAFNGQCATGFNTTTGSFRRAGRCYNGAYNQGFGPTQFSFATNDYNFFVQDDWRYTPRLTVNFGVRYEYEQLPKPFLGNPAVPKTNVLPSDKNNIGPRIGFAWDITGNGKNSLRGGYGIYYGRIINSTILNALTNTGNAGGQIQVSLSQNTSTSCTTATPTTNCSPIFPNTLLSAPPGSTAIQFFQTDFQAPLIHSMDLIVEREISRNTVVSFSFLGSFGRRLPTFVDTNLTQPTTTGTYTILDGPFAGANYSVPLYTGSRPNTSFGAMTEIRSIVSSSYYAFVAQLNRRLTKGLQFQMNYTRSKSRDVGQASVTFTVANSPFDAFNPQAEQGNSNFDIPHKFVANAVWYPHFKVKGAASALLNGWELAPIFQLYSGVPFTPAISGTFPTTGGPSLQATGQNGSSGSTRFALVERNSFRLPKITNLDMRVSRRIHFNETTALEFLVEGFNVFNRTQVTGLNTTLYKTQGTFAAPQLCSTTCSSSPITNFNTVSAAGGTLFRERQIQAAVRFEF